MNRKRGSLDLDSYRDEKSENPEEEPKAVPIAIGRPKQKARNESEIGSPKLESQEVKKSAEVGMSNAEVKKPKSRKPKVESLESEDGDKFETENAKFEINKRQTANSKLQTENTMEVHHHPDVEKKGLKEYLLEGLMIFLAVTMGFFAESIRERVADHEREQQYMESMVRDLALDTAALSAGFPIKEKRLEAMDSVFLFFERNPEPKTVPFNIYRSIMRTTWDMVYTRNTGTIDQLKNAGGLRLIRNPAVRDSLATYDWFWERLRYYSQRYNTDQQLEYGLIERMLNARDLLRSYRLNSSGTSKFPTLSNSSIININSVYQNECLNIMYRQKLTTIQDEQRYKLLNGKAALLIKIIKKEYAIE